MRLGAAKITLFEMGCSHPAVFGRVNLFGGETQAAAELIFSGLAVDSRLGASAKTKEDVDVVVWFKDLR